MAVDLRPGNAVACPMLGRFGHLVDLELFEHLGRRSRAAREALHKETTAPVSLTRKLKRDAPKLRGEGIVDEEDVHRHPPPAEASETNSCASFGRQTSCEY